jgi:hypothetical protein
MKRYSKVDEESVRIYSAVREWARSGLLGKEQGAALAREVQPPLKRTNTFLRAVLFFFTSMIAGATVLLIFNQIGQTDKTTSVTICIVAALTCYVLAEVLINGFLIYRYGVEEALGVMAVVFLVVAAGTFVEDASSRSILNFALSIGAIASLMLYCRLGFRYAGCAAIGCAALVPFSLIEPTTNARVLSAAILLGVFFVTRGQHLKYGDDFPGDDYSVFQSLSWAGLYAVLNLKIYSWGVFDHQELAPGWFYMTTYALIWALPAAGLWIGIRSRHRLFIQANVALALATLATNKAYLGLKHQTWDPMLLGVLLMGTAIVLRRWLVNGPNGERHGFTSGRILSKDAQLMTVVGTASAAFQPRLAHEQPVAEKPRYEGGRSGGAGATGEF